MSVAVKAGLFLAVVVLLLSLIVLGTGLHENPIVGGMGFIVVAIVVNIGAVVWALRQTASESSWVQQLVNGVVIGFVAGVLILAGSWLMLAMIFPDAIANQNAAYIDFMESAGLPQDQIDEQVVKLESRTPIREAVNGLVGTFLTSTILAAIAGIFLRRK